MNTNEYTKRFRQILSDFLGGEKGTIELDGDIKWADGMSTNKEDPVWFMSEDVVRLEYDLSDIEKPFIRLIPIDELKGQVIEIIIDECTIVDEICSHSYDDISAVTLSIVAQFAGEREKEIRIHL